jgi:hypothetical protein
MFKNHEEWSKNKALTEDRQYTVSPNEKAITLHRRVFYDELRENLIIITAEVIVNAQIMSSSFLLPHDVNSLTFRLE